MMDVPPFSPPDSQIIHVEHTASAGSRDEKQSLVRMDKYPGWSRPASDCLNATTELAKQFNHTTVGVAHLIVAMTLVPSAIEQLQRRKIDVDTAFRSAMMALIEMERAKPGDPIAKASSTELTSMLKLAGDIANNRDFQEISVDDLLTALDSLPLDAPAARPIRGGHGSERRFDAAAFESLLANAVERIVGAIPQVPVIDFQTRNELSDIKNGLQSLNAQLSELRRQVSATPVSEPEPQANENKAPEPTPEDSGWMGGIFRVTR